MWPLQQLQEVGHSPGPAPIDGPTAALPPPFHRRGRRRNGNEWSLRRGGGLRRSTQTPGITQLFPQVLEGPNSCPPPAACILGKQEGPFCWASPQTSRNHSHEMQSPTPAARPWGQPEGRGRKAGQGPIGFSCTETSLAFLTSSWQQGPPPSQWLLGPPCSWCVCSWASFPCACMWWDDCRWWSWLPGRAGEIWSQPHGRAWRSVSANLLPLLVEV